MINAVAAPQSELAPSATEGGSLLSTLRDITYAAHIKLQTWNYGPENWKSATLTPEAIGKLGLAAFGIMYAGLTHLHAKYGMDYSHHASDMILAGNTTNLAPAPHHSDNSWMPDTESTHTELAVEPPTQEQMTHPAPNPSHTVSHSPSPSHSAVAVKPSPTPSYDNLPNGPSMPARLFPDAEPKDTHIVETVLCSTAGLGAMLGGFALYLRGQHVRERAKEAQEREHAADAELLPLS